jgi:hypothetical protein
MYAPVRVTGVTLPSRIPAGHFLRPLCAPSTTGIGASIRHDQKVEQDLKQQGYVDTNDMVTAGECTSPGGRIDGSFCITP